jgi:Protein of unknown function (DUF2844)
LLSEPACAESLLMRKALCFLAALPLLVALASPARAALEEQLSDHAKGVSTVSIGGHSLRLRQRGNVKEFADASGKIFAASWTGNTNVSTVLGPHLTAYRAALQANRARSLHVASVRTPDLLANVVVYGAFARGQVVSLKNLPKGVSLDALR